MIVNLSLEQLGLLLTVPGTFVAYFVSTAVTYYKTNHSDFREIEDSLDRENFNKGFIPAYIDINTYLSKQITDRSEKGPQNIDITKYEEAKIALLNDTDFSTLDEAIKFQDVLKLQEEKRNKSKKFQLLKSSVRNCSIAVATTNFISMVLVILGFIVGSSVDTHNILYKLGFVSFFLGIILIVLWFFLRLELDKYENNDS